MIIRKATLADIDTLVGLRIAFFCEVRGELNTATLAAFAEALAGYFTEVMASGDFVAIIAWQNDTPVATAFLSVNRNPPKPGQPRCRSGHITNVYTVPAARGQGLATRLMEALLAEGRAMDLAGFDLSATAAGLPIYEKLGFQVGKEPYLRLNISDSY